VVDLKSWNLASAANKMFGKMYDEPIYPYTDLTNISNTLGLTDITKLPADVWHVSLCTDFRNISRQKGSVTPLHMTLFKRQLE
jgi:hypothetical protein